MRGYVNLVFGTGLPFSPPGLPDSSAAPARSPALPARRYRLF
ncbi:MAG: hypothetical protein WKG07_29910 [Hymenobacter sp.]